jgi:hypothetical protein
MKWNWGNAMRKRYYQIDARDGRKSYLVSAGDLTLIKLPR